MASTETTKLLDFYRKNVHGVGYDSFYVRGLGRDIRYVYLDNYYKYNVLISEYEKISSSPQAGSKGTVLFGEYGKISRNPQACLITRSVWLVPERTVFDSLCLLLDRRQYL